MTLPSPESLLSWPVVIYLTAIILNQTILPLIRRLRANRVDMRRKQAGLSDEKLVDHAVTLKTIRAERASTPCYS